MPQHKFRQTLKKLERKGIKVIEKSEKNTSKVGEKIFALMGLILTNVQHSLSA